MTATLTKTLGSLDDFRGTLCVPGDPDYPRVRAIWNGQVAREPALIATCHDACDVRTVLRRAVDAGMVTAVRGGGHNVAGTALCDGGVVIDLSAMRAVSLDPATGRVRVQGGATLADLDHATVPFARVAPAGIVTTTGVGGLTLGGGVGWTTRRFGLSCDNLVAVRLVTAAGDYLSVDDERDPELMWGLRGGGGNFGIVTEFEFATHPFGPVAVAGFVVYRLDDGPAVLRGYRQFAAAAPEEVTTIVVLRHAPPAPWIPVDQRGKPVVMIGAVHTGSIQTGIEALRPVKSLARPVADTVWPTPFLAHQAVLDASNPAGHRYYWKSDHLAELNDEAIDLLVEQTAQLSPPDSLIGIFQLGGAAARGGERSCFPSRHARFMVNYATHWTEAREDDLHRQWTRDAIEALAPYGLGTAYVNFTADDAPMHVETLYSTTEFSRLVTLKNRLDPDNVFRNNHNIRPSA
ncbi:FAD-binding oxidoreductase [Mycobacterium tuberculosis]|uniref:FAD-binding oxidoreductase n=1 Tax=Mycobacterium tuberculosis TaxID=1773 RepID=UPI0007E98C46|nr:FAD-binding oxidoreductase [Mycobacterium tuberculosis]